MTFGKRNRKAKKRRLIDEDTIMDEEPLPEELLPPPPVVMEDPVNDPHNPEAFYEIERIVGHKDDGPYRDKKTGRMVLARKYLIRWKKYSPDYDSWEPYENIRQDAPETIDLYEHGLKSARIEKKREERAKKEKELEESRKREIQGRQELAAQKARVPPLKISVTPIAGGTTLKVSPKYTDKPTLLAAPTHEESMPMLSPSTGLPKITSKINLKMFRSSSMTEQRLVTEIPDLKRYRIFKIEPPNGQDPDQLIYLLSCPDDRSDYYRITSKNLQKTQEGMLMMCRWLERVYVPFMKRGIETMKKTDKRKLHALTIFTS